MVEPYNDIPKMGVTSFSKEELADVIVKLNEDGMDLHTHTVGDAASRVVLDAVEIARKRLGESYRVRVTCAHLKFQHDADLDRFVKLGVFANFTPWWNSELPSEQIPLFGEERTRKMYRCKTLWNTGALVTWSSRHGSGHDPLDQRKDKSSRILQNACGLPVGQRAHEH